MESGLLDVAGHRRSKRSSRSCAQSMIGSVARYARVVDFAPPGTDDAKEAWALVQQVHESEQ